MSKTVVIYKSKYGSTKKYAEWIATALGADIFEASKIDATDMQKYSTIIYGGGLYASGILGISLITKAFDKLKDKNLVVFTVGLADPSNTEQFIPVIDKNLTKEMQKSIKLFHFRGAIDYKNLGLIHKSMMALLKNKVSKMPQDKMDDETKMMIETYGQVVNFTEQSSIKPLIEFCNGL
ncbi:flavodoxin domain-containing protein [Clostridium subterminale]|uniref:Flavodoxin domain-containing protein n=1 Tax=Clostridium subterminale TaxID=1550 RepID=A0ABP3W4W1_CLOSU